MRDARWIIRRLVRSARHLSHYWIDPVFPVRDAFGILSRYPRFLSDRSRYSDLAETERLRFRDSYPILTDNLHSTPFDPHYFYQAVWGMERITNLRPGLHVDIGSDVKFVGMLSTQVPVTFVDIRPLVAHLPGLTSISGSLLSLPFGNASIQSLSCMHVAEHVGLGRYGDPLDPLGTGKACTELARVLAVGGTLYFSLPVGKPRVCFNAHRIHSPRQIISYFRDLELVEFSAVDDQGNYIIDVEPEQFDKAHYSCGLFRFLRSKGSG